jgi:Tol biopolymer transport system component/DNA-binding winged helix-turn-helix (wHTH) protein
MRVENLEKTERIAFDRFEMDLRSGEIWKSGYRVRLQDQPFRVLAVLLTKAGQVVTHSELQFQVWGPDTNVDIERALAVAIKKIREALSDSAENPKFVETLAKRGYRFIAPVTEIPGAFPSLVADDLTRKTIELYPQPSFAPTPGVRTATPTAPTPIQTPRLNPGQEPAIGNRALPKPHFRTMRHAVRYLAIATLVVGIGVALWLQGRSTASPPLHIDQITHNSPISAGPPNMENLPALATDGQRIFASVLGNGKPQLSAIDISTGAVQPLTIPKELTSGRVADISKDGSKLLVRSQLSPQSEQPLWVVPTAGGSALRLGNVQAQDATWMPDGTSILFANGNELNQIRLDGGTITPIAKLPGRAFWLRWSPDGTLLRFTVMDSVTHTASLWELKRGSKTARPLLKNRIGQELDCCGSWTADGSAYVFQSSGKSGSNLWELKSSVTGSSLTQLTNGPLTFFSPIAARSGQRLYFYGSDQPSGLQRYQGQQLGFRPERTFLGDANRVAYSRDRQWVAWEDFAARLWRARASDGSDKILLTPDDLEVFLAQWSPDGSKLAIMARRPGETWQIYVVSADGGKPERLMKDDRNVADPGWSEDGKEIVFGREPDSMGKESGPRTIEIFNLRTQTTTTVPQSEGLFSPRWSPDGKWIAALTLAQNKLMLFDVANQPWSELASTSASDPVWSNDSKAIFIHAFLAENQPILKVSVPNGEVSVVASSADFHSGEPADYFFGGMTPDEVPLVRPRVGTGNLFMMDLDRH